MTDIGAMGGFAHTTREDAERQAMSIRQYWKARGFKVTFKIYPVTHQSRASWIFRTDMVNGLPRKATWKDASEWLMRLSNTESHI